MLRIDQFKRARQRAQELMIKAQQSWVKHKDTPEYCYDHALLVTGYDVLLSTLQGNLSFSTSSASSFASTHAGPDYFSLLDLHLRHRTLSDSCPKPSSHALPHGQSRSFVIFILFPLDVIMTYDSDPDSDLILPMTSLLTDPL